MFPLPALCLAILTACQQQDAAPDNVQRITLSEVPATSAPAASEDAPEDAVTLSDADDVPGPDTSNARWIVASDGRAIVFGDPGGPPLITLGCEVRANPPQMRIVRHVTAEPGAKALFPVLGNGTVSRFKVDAQVLNGQWAWAGSLPARDPDLDVFTGRGRLLATLPGGGTVEIAGSRLPGEFVRWCRSGGQSPTPG
ncbi:hypothetical protein [Altericroceibacterium xinjiangense]|uniref:hypothetical protein n=1 Tax=Altericroceibacterium xinjiangense TaxID=762261 RepID=UPI000F7ED9AC|nr:hypothetical protein [Altericroceibacterium xinjiangense]